jgi:mono/diheme cytochrome c family protein
MTAVRSGAHYGIAAAIALGITASPSVQGVGFVNRTAAVASTRIPSGVYTKEQAARGERMYVQHCEICHLSDLLGFDYNPPLVGAAFYRTWKGRTLSEMFAKTQETMPKTAPGSLSLQQYVDVISYVLSMNGWPAGDTELSPKVVQLKAIIIEPREP